MSSPIQIEILYKNRNGTNYTSKGVKQKKDFHTLYLQETTLELAGIVPDYRDSVTYYTDADHAALYTRYYTGEIKDIEFWRNGDRWEDVVEENEKRILRYVWDTVTQKVYLKNVEIPLFRVVWQSSWGHRRAGVGWGYCNTQDLKAAQSWAVYFPVTEGEKMLTYLHRWAEKHSLYELEDKSIEGLQIFIPEPFQVDVVGILQEYEIKRLQHYTEEDQQKLQSALREVAHYEGLIAERAKKIAEIQTNFNYYHILGDD